MFYSLIKPLLFRLNPETAHQVALKSLNVLYHLHLLGKTNLQAKPVTVMGLNFPHRVGLAAGLDKNADYVDALSALGFGFIEIGTVTPRPQAGNPKPRLFRLDEEQAIINRMGFNSKGVDYVAKQLAKIKYRGVLGINIGKNRDTPNHQAIDDYRYALRKLAAYASYITINISSPNTAGLRDLQSKDALHNLLSILKQDQQLLLKTSRYIPLVVKISPDLNDEELKDIASVLLDNEIDCVIATNTTLSREAVMHSPYAKEAGGLSGRPLTTRATEIVRKLASFTENKIPIIASGGVMDATDVAAKIAAGASLVQVYSGFIFNGVKVLEG